MDQEVTGHHQAKTQLLLSSLGKMEVCCVEGIMLLIETTQV